MSFCTAAGLLPVRFRLVLTSFLQQPGLAFAEALPEERIIAAFAEERISFATAIKITLGIDLLRCKSPAMIRREIWACLLAYNLVRQTILNAARPSGLSPRQLSFTAAMQQIAASWTTVLPFDAEALTTWLENQRQALAEQRVGDRPDRVEPRAIKRRSKPHKLLTKPRNEARAELLAG